MRRLYGLYYLKIWLNLNFVDTKIRLDLMLNFKCDRQKDLDRSIKKKKPYENDLKLRSWWKQ